MIERIKTKINNFISRANNPRNYPYYMLFGVILIMLLLFYFLAYQSYKPTPDFTNYPRLVKEDKANTLYLWELRDGSFKIVSRNAEISEEEAKELLGLKPEQEVIFDVSGAATEREILENEIEILTEEEAKKLGYPEDYGE